MTLATSTLQVDTHAHVFLRSLPLVPNRRYELTIDAPLSEYLAHLDANGFTHGVLIQPSFLGTDNSFLIEALALSQGRLRGVVVVDTDIAHSELAAMDKAGVAGIRLNLVGKEVPDFSTPDWQGFLSQIRQLDWHVEVHALAEHLPAIVPSLLACGVRIVIDHFGRPDVTQGIADPGFQFLLSCASSRQVWVKLSAGYRLGAKGSQLPKEAASCLLNTFGPERLLWGSDWPHTMHEKEVKYQETLQAFHEWIPNPEDRHHILNTTPAELFRITA